MADRTPPRPGRSSSSSASSHGSSGGARSSSRAGSGPRSAGSRPGARPGTARSSATRPGARGAAQGKGPGKERPALAARARTAEPVPPSPSTTLVRGVILLGILVMLAVTLVPTLRSVVQQRSDAAALADKVAGQRATVAELERQAALWKDPAYIEVQARERLKFVRVGDRAYTVLDAAPKASDAAAAPAPVVAAPMANQSSPWYGKLWQSVQIADRPTAGIPKTK